MRGRVRLVTIVIALAGTRLLAGQTPQPRPTESASGPTFRAQIEYVEVDALVADPQGNLVTGLQKEDFQVFEDGEPQTISAFSFVDIPIERGTRPSFEAGPVEPDIQTNDRPFDGRIYVMVLDDLHVDVGRSAQVKQAARQFIERDLNANDLMAVTFTGRADAAQEFTHNKRLLLNSVDTFLGRHVQGSTLTRNDTYHQRIDLPASGRSPFVEDMNDTERGNDAQSMLRTLRQVADWLAGVRGRRKTLMLLSEGIDYDLSDLIRGPTEKPSAASAILSDIRATLERTARSNVSIYGIDPRGLATTGGEATVAGFADQNEPSTGIGLGSLRGELSQSQDSLRRLSEESGGFAAVNSNDLTGAFDRIVRDNSSYYLLAYYPPSTSPDGKFHRIEVHVSRPGLTVRARRGYAAPPAPSSTRTAKPANPGGMPRELSDALNSLLPVSGLTMRVFAAPFKSSKRNAAVMVGIELTGHDMSLDPNSKVDVALMAVDRKSKVFGARRDTLSLNGRPESLSHVAPSSIRLLNRLELPPGRYRLRAAALDTQTKQAGSVVYDLDVPDFYKVPMAMSGVTVTSLAGATMTTAIVDERLKDLLPAPFIALRDFSQKDELDFFAEVYDDSGKAPHKIDIVSTLSTGEGRQVFENREQHDSTELKGATRALRYTARLPLLGLAPGDYMLRVEARSPLGKNTSATRQLPFRVLPSDSGRSR